MTLRILTFVSKISATEFAIFDDGVQVLNESLEHVAPELHSLLTPHEQGRFRLSLMMETLEEQDIDFKLIDMIVTQTECTDVPCGIYLVNRKLVDYLKDSKLEENHQRAGIFMLYTFAEYINSNYDAECIPILVEAAIEDEIMRDAVLSGLKGLPREPVFHVFSHRSAAAVYAWENNRGQNDVSLVIAHLGTEISVGAFDRGRIIDSNSPLDGEGPFSPTASGTLPADALVELCFSGRYDMDEMLNKVTSEGGITAHLGSGRLASVQEAWHKGDERTRFVVTAMAARVAKEIGARAAALQGRVEGIVLTGPWSSFTELTDEIASRVQWIASTKIYTWGSEMYNLAIAAMEIFNGNIKLLLFGENNR